MIDLPVEAWRVGVGLAPVGLALLGAAVRSRSTAPSATATADAVDAVAGGGYAATGEHRLGAEDVRIEPHRIGVRAGGRVDYEPFAFGPVTPVARGTLLWEVLRGAPPSHVFDSPAAFEAEAAAAREREPRWRPADGRLLVRSATWEDVELALVGT